MVLRDILRDTPAYQDILQEGLEEGLERGLEQGLEKGLEQGLELGRKEGLEILRQLFLNFVLVRYPDLVAEAKKRSDGIDDPEILNDLTLKVGLAQDVREFRDYLLSI